jgi:phosphatidylethanolamine-binding protein (PEBP) family uncharacterized protein
LPTKTTAAANASADDRPRKVQKDSGEAQGRKAAAPQAPKESEGGGGDAKYEKKHPPLELPEGPPEPKITKAQRERVPTADIAVTVPGGLGAANTCNGEDLSPAISWGKLPADTAEVAIFATGVEPVGGELGYIFALAGVEPSLTGLKAGEIPKGAILGRTMNGKKGYSLCPAGTDAETYVFSVYAIAEGLSPKQGFDPAALRKEASRASDDVGIVAVTSGG